MLRPKSFAFDIPADRLDRFRSLFFSEAEYLSAIRKETGADLGAQRKSFAELQALREVPIRDPVLRQRLLALLDRQGLQKIRVSAYYSDSTNDGLVALVRIKAAPPSIAFKLLFQDEIGCNIRVRAERKGAQAQVNVEAVGRRALDILGCLALVVAFGACVLPGFAVLYFLHRANTTWSEMTAAVSQALKASLTELEGA